MDGMRFPMGSSHLEPINPSHHHHSPHTVFMFLVSLGESSQLLAMSIPMTLAIATLVTSLLPHVLNLELLVVVGFSGGGEGTQHHQDNAQESEDFHFCDLGIGENWGFGGKLREN